MTEPPAARHSTAKCLLPDVPSCLHSGAHTYPIAHNHTYTQSFPAPDCVDVLLGIIQRYPPVLGAQQEQQRRLDLLLLTRLGGVAGCTLNGGKQALRSLPSSMHHPQPDTLPPATSSTDPLNPIPPPPYPPRPPAARVQRVAHPRGEPHPQLPSLAPRTRAETTHLVHMCDRRHAPEPSHVFRGGSCACAAPPLRAAPGLHVAPVGDVADCWGWGGVGKGRAACERGVGGVGSGTAPPRSTSEGWR